MTVRDRLLAKVNIDEATGCWNWVGTKSDRGYGRLWIDGRLARSHRVSYELFVGPVPEDLQLDHLCRNRGCCNPNHLEPVTNRVNQLRAPRSFDVSVTCASGRHVLTPDLIQHRSDGSRQCRACRRESQNEWSRRRRSA